MKEEKTTPLRQRMIEDMRQVQPAGPYRLAGYSMGGKIVHEIAQQLAEIDEVERKLTNVEVKLVPIREIKAGLAVWLSPSARVLGSLMETLGTSPSVLFPDLPTDNSPLPGAH